MKISKLGFFSLCALVCTGLAISIMGCAPMGTMNGGVGVNIGEQPIWGPAGYDRADYYYIPDIDSYYSVSERQYIYRDGESWKHDSALPSSYKAYDPYHSYKVVINEDKPYQNNSSHVTKYGTFKGVKDQPVIRDSRDPKYFVNKEHPEHDNWERQQKH